ncbi:MAG: hypothetical protein JNM22_05725 [Saprospiraceae bacterium]|nr:hypothetical protein [Saprospiraceae bacterium]
MPSKKPDRIFTIDDWTEASQLERMYIHLMQPDEFPLNAPDEIRLEALRETWAVMCSKQSMWRRMKVLRKVFQVSERTIQRYMEDAKYLFGDILKTDVDIELAILRDKYFALAERCELAGDYTGAKNNLKAAEEVIEKIEARQPKAKRVYANVIFTDNPKVLTSRIEDAEDVEYVDESADLLELEAIKVPAGHSET